MPVLTPREHIRRRSVTQPTDAEPMVSGYSMRQQKMQPARVCDSCGAPQSRYRRRDETMCSLCAARRRNRGLS